MAEQKNWLDEVYDACSGVDDVSSQLEELAKAFNRLGNEEVSNELSGLASVLRQSQRTVRTAIGEMSHDQVQKGQKELCLVAQVALSKALKG